MSGDSLFDLSPQWNDPTAVISDDGLYRYELTRRWKRDGDTMTFVMLNPSTADALQDDPTIRRCIGFAKREGCSALRVLNLYAYRTPSPAELWSTYRRHVDIVGPENDHWLGSAGRHDGPVVAAWGNQPEPDRIQEAIRLLTSTGRPLHVLAMTSLGQPGHPLYLRGDAPLVEWSP